MNITYGTYTAMTVTNLQSLANDSADPFAGWQSARVSNLATLADNYEIIIHLPMAATAPANDKCVYVYIVPWETTDGGTTWQYGANFGTTTAPTGSEGTASISDPNSMIKAARLPYFITSQPINGYFSLLEFFSSMPDGWSLAIRDCTGAALSTGCTVGYRPITLA